MSMKTLLETAGHESNKTGSPGFHGKYDSKAGKNKPTSRNYTFVPIRYGTPDVPEKCKPSYAKITYKNTITVIGIVHDLTIFDSAAWVDGMKIVSAPDHFTNARKEKFLKAVIWSMINDQENFFDQLNRCTDIRDKIPAPVIIPAVPVIVPEICIESITGSVYPGPGIIEEYPVNYEIETDNLSSLLNEELSDMYLREYDVLDQAFNPEPAEEIIRAFEPAPVDVIRSWSIPQLRITIQECVLA